MKIYGKGISYRPAIDGKQDTPHNKEIYLEQLDEYIGDAESCVCRDNSRAIQQLLSGEFSVDDVYAKDWQYPAGAFKGADGGPC